MSRPSSEKCRLCAKLAIAQAQVRHGSKGTGCWDDAHCHQRRSYYRSRDRYNKARRLKRQSSNNTPLEVPITPAPAAVLHLYRERVDAPLHAIGAELWLGQERKAAIEPVHCLGLTSRQITAYRNVGIHPPPRRGMVFCQRFYNRRASQSGVITS